MANTKIKELINKSVQIYTGMTDIYPQWNKHENMEATIISKDKNEELFQQAKSRVLLDELINDAKYKDLKEWIEQIDSSETDDSRLESIRKSYLQKIK